MRHGSLFSGIGGFDLAAEWMGWENIFHCEWMPFPRKILSYYFPNSISYEDITKTDFSIHRGTIDILTGGFPCQPYSSAGKRLGKEDERHLWPHMLRAIQEIRPTYVVGENVRGLTNWSGGLVFEEVCTDLEGQGYEVQPVLLPACSVGAPHRRDRVWFVAYSNCNTRRSANCNWQNKGEHIFSRSSRFSEERTATNTKSQGTWEQPSENSRWEDRRFNNDDETWTTTDTECNGLEYSKKSTSFTSSKIETRKYITRYSSSESWSRFPTQSPICGGNDGLPTELDGITFSKWRAESIKGYGNAIVPQVAFQIFKVIQHMEDVRTNQLTIFDAIQKEN